MNGFDFYFYVDFLNSPPFARESVKSPLRHCDSPIKCSNFAIFMNEPLNAGECCRGAFLFSNVVSGKDL